MRERSWKDLKQKQKLKISEIMFSAVCDYYKVHEQMPVGPELDALAKAAFTKIAGIGLGISYDAIYEVFVKKQGRFEERIRAQGIPAPSKPKEKKSEAEKLALKRAARKRRKAKKAAREDHTPLDRDDRFFLIVGYTSGGAPYGVTWEEMGLEPWEELE